MVQYLVLRSAVASCVSRYVQPIVSVDIFAQLIDIYIYIYLYTGEAVELAVGGAQANGSPHNMQT